MVQAGGEEGKLPRAIRSPLTAPLSPIVAREEQERDELTHTLHSEYGAVTKWWQEAGIINTKRKDTEEVKRRWKEQARTP